MEPEDDHKAPFRLESTRKDENKSRVKTMRPSASFESGSFRPLTPPNSSFASTTFPPSPADSLDGLPKRQATAPDLSEDGSSYDGNTGDEDDDERDRVHASLPLLLLHPEATAGTQKAGDGSCDSTANVPSDARQPTRRMKRPIEEDISLAKEAKRSRKMIFAFALRAAATNPIVIHVLGYSLLVPFMLFVALYLVPLVSAIVVRESLKAGSGYLWSPVRALWNWGTVTLYTLQGGAVVFFGTRLGFIPPTVLPPLGAEHAVNPPLIQRTPLAHVDGMVLAQQIMAPHASQLHRSLEPVPGTSRNQLFFPDGLVVQFPFAPFDPTLRVRIDTIATDNERLGTHMRRSIEAERAALRSFRRLLREEPAASLLEKQAAAPPASATRKRPSAWQTLQTMFWRLIRPSARSHLLRQVGTLESMLEKGLAQRAEWARHLYNSELSQLQLLEVPVCQASKMLGDIKWKVEAKMDELPPPLTIDGGHSDDSLTAPGRSSTGVSLAGLSRNLADLDVVHANFAHMCLSASADRKAATKVTSKLADDKKWYREALESLAIMRARLEASSLTDLPSVVTFEREMDEVALFMLKGIKYWEQRHGSD